MLTDQLKPSTISRDLDVERNKRLLKARQWRWEVAKRWQVAQFVVGVFPPILAVTIGLTHPITKPWIAFIAVLATLLDVAVIDRRYKDALKIAAKASELFDVQLLGLPWNALVAGNQPSPEDTDRAVRGWHKLKKPFPIDDWYASGIDRAPLALARAICQRTNLSYDSDLRGLYGSILLIALSTVCAAIFAVGLFSKMTFSEFVLAGWVPFSPFLTWMLRERFRQTDAVQANAPIKTQAENLLTQIIDGSCADEECEAQSRSLQNAIYQRRAGTVLLMPGIYALRREDAERDMQAGADFWLDRAGV